MGFIVFLLLVIVGILLYIAIKYQAKNKEMVTTLENYVANNKVVTDVDDYYQKKQMEVEVLQNQKKHLVQEITELNADLVVDTVFNVEYVDIPSDQIKNKLALLRNDQKELVKSGSAVIVTSQEKKSVITKQIQQILRCYNAETTDILGKVTVKNVDTSRNKLTKSFEAINKIFKVDGVQLSSRYLESKYKELSLIYSYMRKLEDEAEAKRAAKEKLIEQQKFEREVAQKEERIIKDQKQTQNEVNKLMKYMQKAHDDIERQLYIDKIQELEAKLKELEEAKKDVSNWKMNAKAGYVYIISNVGSFGENVYKIGMTRRLEPMDRIRELSSASVPFVFDVHALIFSNDAPGLEAILHQYFDSKRVNKVNTRKEFFKVDLEEIKKVVLENHNATVNFIDVPDAVEYRETLKLEGKKMPVEVHYSEESGVAVTKHESQTSVKPVKKVSRAKPVKIRPKVQNSVFEAN